MEKVLIIVVLLLSKLLGFIAFVGLTSALIGWIIEASWTERAFSIGLQALVCVLAISFLLHLAAFVFKKIAERM